MERAALILSLEKREFRKEYSTHFAENFCPFESEEINDVDGDE